METLLKDEPKNVEYNINFQSNVQMTKKTISFSNIFGRNIIVGTQAETLDVTGINESKIESRISNTRRSY